MVKVLFFCFFFCCVLESYAQQKYEREYKINTAEVPQKALDFIKAFEIQKKVKWYQEQGLDSTSIEAKFKLKGAKYSIEFSNDGTLQDIEQTVSFKTLQKDIQEKIQSYFEENYDAYNIEKVQLQYTGKLALLLMWREASDFPRYPSRQTAVSDIVRVYELVVRTRTESKVLLFQFQFDEKGQKIDKKEIITRDTDILKF